ncbi:helix-turn-helix transcriptional regulator [Kordia sp. YSTF-M3]|uniref:Helix-turn-helix transcriptional regulator n=1 Tax=Kordia aestuariivivens TaxID=2759037 RepID=A0ABR7QCD2_9FLAO|nr:AraC family transcriptional regulator [Kordia aestuariivivens]MBC8756215.1 helix-turn-helix transcriptional regulator [Kordia aestuariivivens]
METTINLWIMLFFAFAIQSFVLGILFFLKRKGDRIANCIFGVFLLLFAYNQIFNCAYWSNYQGSFVEHLSFTNFIPWVSYGPLLYIYIKRVLNRTPFTWRDLQHAIPIVWIFAVFGRFYFLPYSIKLELVETGNYADYVNWWPIPRYYMVFTVTLLMFLYVIKIYGLYKKDKDNVPYPQRLWVKSLWICFTGYTLIFFAYFLLIYFRLLTISNDYLIGYGITFFIGIVTYFSFMQPNIFSGTISFPFVKYQNNGLSSSLATEMKDKLVSLMEADKLFLDNSLTLDVLSDELNLSRHHTSQLINESFKVNFFEFVNNYRIDEAIKLLKDEKSKLNINQIIYAAGFNNRTSFYNAFKKKTGISPKSYRNKNKKAL